MRYTATALALMAVPFVAAQSLADLPKCAVSWQYHTLQRHRSSSNMHTFSSTQHKLVSQPVRAKTPTTPVSAKTLHSCQRSSKRLIQHAVHMTKRVSVSSFALVLIEIRLTQRHSRNYRIRPTAVRLRWHNSRHTRLRFKRRSSGDKFSCCFHGYTCSKFQRSR